LESILKQAKLAVVSIGPWATVVFIALALSSSDGFAFGAKPDLGVIIAGAGSDMRPVVAPGQPFSFRIGLDNMNGATDAHQVRLTAILPKGLKFQSSVPPPTRVESENHPVWELDTVRAKALAKLFEVTAQADTNLAPGRQLEISAEAQGGEGNASSADNHASYTVYVQAAWPALVFLGSTLDSVPLTTDGPATFQVTLRNAGFLPAIDSRLEVTLPKEVKFDKGDPQPESSSGQVVTFKLGDLARAESRSVTMTVELDPRQLSEVSLSDVPLSFAFRASHIASGAEVTDTHFEVTKRIESAGQDVAVWLTTVGAKEPGEVSPRDKVTCAITYANLGNQPAHKVSVALSLGEGLEIAHSDPPPSGTATNSTYPGGVVHWDIGDLDIGMQGSIRSVIHVTSVPDDGALVTASITADGVDLDASNNTASVLWHRPLSAAAVKAAAFHPSGRALAKTHHHLRHLFELILVVGIGWVVVRTFRRA